MNSRSKKSVAAVTTAATETQSTNEQLNATMQTQPEEKYVKKHPLNVNPTFNKRLSLL